MNKPIRTTTPRGEEIVILPAADYDRLLGLAEDRRDVALAEKALAEFEGRKGDALSEADMRDLLAAPTPLSFWRKRRGLTQSALAKDARISQAYLAQIEKGTRIGDVRLYGRLAHALRMEIDDLLPPEPTAVARRKPARARRKQPR